MVQGIDTNWFGRTHETTHNQATLTAPLGVADRSAACGAAIGHPQLYRCQCSRTPVYRRGVNGLVLRITLIREVSWTCPADEYLHVQYYKLVKQV
jgi:hypothetical protein